MKRLISITATLMLLLCLTAGCIVINVERKANTEETKKTPKAVGVEVVVEDEESSE